MPADTLRFTDVFYTYDSLPDELLTDLTFAVSSGWTGVVGRNGAGKSTLLRLAVGEAEPTSGVVDGPSPGLIVAQRTDDPPDRLTDLIAFPDAEAGRLVSILGIDADWPYRWATLSHGERKRAQIGVALWINPPLLAVDEPTNHLDGPARRMLATALSRYSGVGLLVSHDRQLLDTLCSQCLFLSPPRPPRLRPGGVSAGMEEQRREDEEARRAYDRSAREVRRIQSEVTRRRADADVGHQQAMRSKRHLRRKDSDAREKIDRARISGADGNAGRKLNQIEGRARQANEQLESLTRPPSERTGLTIRGVRSQSDAVARLDACTLPVGPDRALEVPELVVEPSDRIGLVGANGAGKSTLLEAFRAAGQFGSDHVLYIRQELSSDEARDLVRRVRDLRRDALARVLSTIARLGSVPERILDTDLPSPGETRKLMLAEGLERKPDLVVMDEPTNHLDLLSIQCMEVALADYPGAVILVSHDVDFLEALVRDYWEVEVEGNRAGLTIRPGPASRPDQ